MNAVTVQLDGLLRVIHEDPYENLAMKTAIFYNMRQARKDHKFYACVQIYDILICRQLII